MDANGWLLLVGGLLGLVGVGYHLVRQRRRM